MSRIQDILSKAERDGTARRTRSLSEEAYATRPSEEAVRARAFVDAPPAAIRRPDLALPPPVPVERYDHAIADAAPATIAEPPVPAAIHTRGGDDEVPHTTLELDPHLVAALAPTSVAAEQYRSLRTRIKRAEGGRALRTIAVTSPAKGDGKSLTAANLALTMAQEFQQRVLLLDADLRRPSVHRLFGMSESPGLADVLTNIADVDHALVAIREHHLNVMPAGVPPAHPAELLGSATMRRLLDTLRARFDKILIDVPPVAPLADLHVLAPMVDGLLLIVRAGVTQKPAIERALSGLDQSKVLGLVLNESGGTGGDEYGYEGYGYLAG